DGLELILEPGLVAAERDPEALEAGVLVAVEFHAQHLDDLVAALAQLAQGGLLGAGWVIERQIGREAVAGDETGIDRIGLGRLAIEAGEQAGAAAMGAVAGH